MKSTLSKNYLLVTLAYIVGVINLTSCGKSVSIGQRLTLPNQPSTQQPEAPPSSCTPETWEFTQPPSSAKKKLDILFVTDTSDSLKNERSRIAQEVPYFIYELPATIDYRIGVMLAHGGSSQYSGQLYSTSGYPKVLDSQTHSLSYMQNALSSSLKFPQLDKDEADGELLIYSLLRSLSPDPLSKIQTQGFYRADAGLAVIFITDENDPCYPPELQGFTEFPDFVRSQNDIEKVAYQKYCSSLASDPNTLLKTTLSQLQTQKQDQLVSLHGIIYHEPNQVPKGGEEAIGHGILELIQQSPQGSVIELSQETYAKDLASLGKLITHQLALSTRFHLTGLTPLQKEQLVVEVDGVAVPFDYSQETREIMIQLENAGKPESKIQVRSCSS